MTQKEMSFQNRREFILASAASLLAGCASNSETSPAANIRSFKMGDRAAVGVVTYNVLEAEYKTQLGTISNPRMPKSRFLILRLSITNGGAKEVDLPLFSLIDSDGNTHLELQEAEGVPNWLGILRRIAPTTTEEGRILFDVMPKDYKLEITDGGETGKETLAHIEIPMQFDIAEPVPAAGQSATRP